MIIITILEGTCGGHLFHPVLPAGSTSKSDGTAQGHIQLKPDAFFSGSGLLGNAPGGLMLLLLTLLLTLFF